MPSGSPLLVFCTTPAQRPFGRITRAMSAWYHVARAMYGMEQKGMPTDTSALVQVLAGNISARHMRRQQRIRSRSRSQDDGSTGSNKKIYDRSDVEVNEVYRVWGFKATMEAFEDGICKSSAIKFDSLFPGERGCADRGRSQSRENIWQKYLRFPRTQWYSKLKSMTRNSTLKACIFYHSGAGLPTY